MSPLRLIVYLHDVLAGRGTDVFDVEVHGCYGGVVCVSVADCAGAEVPYLLHNMLVLNWKEVDGENRMANLRVSTDQQTR